MQVKKPRPGTGMALSGGGFRATLFHLGALWRLNELGYLKKIKRICSVSGGSVTAGVLGYCWKELEFNKEEVAENFVDKIAAPLCSFCSLDIDVPSILGGWLSVLRSPGDMLTARYRKHLFGDSTLQDLPSDDEGPRFILYATNLQTGVSVRFSRPYLADYRLGLLDRPNTPLARAVAASSAFPPVFTPIVLKTDPGSWRRVEGADLYDRPSMRKEIYLSDGGVYDNLGLEAVWDDFSTVIVSDAGAPFKVQSKPRILRISQIKKMIRVLNITMEQTRALRKRRLINDFINNVREGTYWGIATHIDDYRLSDPLVSDNELTGLLKKIPTRLNSFSKKDQGRLINWGYALADAAMRRHVLSGEIPAGKWPMPEYHLNA